MIGILPWSHGFHDFLLNCWVLLDLINEMSKKVPFKKRGYSPINLDHETELLDISDEKFDPPQPAPVLFHNENSE